MYCGSFGATAWAPAGPYASAAGGFIGSAVGFFAGKTAGEATIMAIPLMKQGLENYNKAYPIDQPGNLIFHVK